MKAISKKDLALRAIYDVRNSQWNINQEQNKLLAANKIAFEETWQDVSLDTIVQDVRDSISKDLEDMKLANAKVTEYKNLHKDVRFHYGISTNKMVEILTGVRQLFEEDSNIFKIASGQLPTNYDNQVVKGTLPKLGAGEFWGSSQSTFLTSAASIVNMHLKAQSKISLDPESYSSYSVPYPKTLELGIDTRYIYEANEQSHLGFYHSGYLFGGDRTGTHSLNKPQDCSSFLEKLTDVQTICPGATATTADLVCIQRKGTGVGFIPNDWSATKSGQLINLYSLTTTQNPGDIWVKRGFKESPNENLGTSGHVAIVIDNNQDGTVTTVGVNRDMPTIEGYGTQIFSSASSGPNELIFFLAPTTAVLEGQGFSEFSGIPYSGSSDLATVLDLFDQEINLSGANIEDAF